MFPNDIILSELRTYAYFPVTTVPRVVNTARRAKSICALRIHVTDGRRRGEEAKSDAKMNNRAITYSSLVARVASFLERVCKGCYVPDKSHVIIIIINTQGQIALIHFIRNIIITLK